MKSKINSNDPPFKKIQTNSFKRLRGADALRRTEGGLVKMIIVFIAVLLIIAYFGLNIRSIVDSQTFQDNWAFIRDGSLGLWNGYLKAPLDYFWNSIFIPYVWQPIFNNLTHNNATI